MSFLGTLGKTLLRAAPLAAAPFTGGASLRALPITETIASRLGKPKAAAAPLPVQDLSDVGGTPGQGVDQTGAPVAAASPVPTQPGRTTSAGSPWSDADFDAAYEPGRTYTDMPGWDTAKLNDRTRVTPKYLAGRTIQNRGLTPTADNVNELVKELVARKVKATGKGGDILDVGSDFEDPELDVIAGLKSNNPAWAWNSTRELAKANAAPQQASASRSRDYGPMTGGLQDMTSNLDDLIRRLTEGSTDNTMIRQLLADRQQG